MKNTVSPDHQEIARDLEQLAKVSHTLFIPLKGRAHASKARDDFEDPWAQQLFQRYDIPTPDISRATVGFSICRAKWLDRWANELLAGGGTLVQLGPGLCSRAWRLSTPAATPTLEIDLPGVVQLKKKLFSLPSHIQVEAIDFLDPAWCHRAQELGPAPYVLVMEGVSMYLAPDFFLRMLDMMANNFPKGSTHLLFDYVNPLIARHTILLPSVYKTGARFSGNGFYRWQLAQLHARAAVVKQMALPRVYLPSPWHLLAEMVDWYSLGHLNF